MSPRGLLALCNQCGSSYIVYVIPVCPYHHKHPTAVEEGKALLKELLE